jgi:hypothetical protein
MHKTFYMKQEVSDLLDVVAKRMYPLRKNARSLTLETLIYQEAMKEEEHAARHSDGDSRRSSNSVSSDHSESGG